MLFWFYQENQSSSTKTMGYEISIVALKHTHCTNFLIVQILCLSPPQRRGNFEYVILVLKNNTTVTARGHHMKWIQWIVISYKAFWPVSVQAWKLLLIVFKLKKKIVYFYFKCIVPGALVSLNIFPMIFIQSTLASFHFDTVFFCYLYFIFSANNIWLNCWQADTQPPPWNNFFLVWIATPITNCLWIKRW